MTILTRILCWAAVGIPASAILAWLPWPPALEMLLAFAIGWATFIGCEVLHEYL